MKIIWPNFFIVGAPRAGHTSLYNYLDMVQGIYMSPAKAPGYFLSKDFDGKYDKEKYLALFKDVKDEKAIGEASSYMTDSESPKLIHEQIPNAKIIMILRDPIQRAYSHHLQALRGVYENLTFEKAFHDYLKTDDKSSGFYKHIIGPGFYYKPVKKFQEIFGPERVKIVIFEEYVQDTKKTVKDILEFLEVEAKLPENVNEEYNVYSEPLGKFGTSIVKNKLINKFAKKFLIKSKRQEILRTVINKKGKKPKMSDEDRILLKRIYKKDVLKLKELLGHELPWSTAE